MGRPVGDFVLNVVVAVVVVMIFDCCSCGRVGVPELASAVSGAKSYSPSADVWYEPGFVVETVLNGKDINESFHSTFPIPGGRYVYVLDSTASEVLKIALPIDENTAVIKFAGSEGGKTGHRDGWGKHALFNHPNDLTVDEDGNLYVADVRDRVIRKVDSSGMVTTIAGESNQTGHVDGQGREARFSDNFGLTYLPTMCSLLISDRGNRRLRLIKLKPQGDCRVAESSGVFSVGFEGLFFVVTATFTLSVLAVKVCTAQRISALQSSLQLPWRQDDDINPLLSSGVPPMLTNSGTRHASSLPSHLSRQEPDLIDLNDSLSAHRAGYLPDIGRSALSAEDDAASLQSPLLYTQSAPAALDYTNSDFHAAVSAIRDEHAPNLPQLCLPAESSSDAVMRLPLLNLPAVNNSDSEIRSLDAPLLALPAQDPDTRVTSQNE